MIVKSVVFDLDGTLVDSAPDIIEALRQALLATGLRDIPELPSTLVGPPIRDILRKLPIEIDNATEDRIVAHFRSIYDNGPMERTVLYPGVFMVLQTLKRFGVTMYVATNKPHQPTTRLLANLVPDLIRDQVCIDSLMGRRLDKTQMVGELMSRHRLEAETTCVVGDGGSDIRAAIGQGCMAVAALYGYGSRDELEEAGALRFLNAPTDILSIVGIVA